MPTLLVIDDEPSILDAMRQLGRSSGFDVVCCASGRSGIDAARQSRPDVAIVDLRIPDIDGLQVLQAIHRETPRCRMVLMTGYASVDTAVEAIRLGAMDYLSKPLDVGRVEQLLQQVRDETARPSPALADEDTESYGMVGRSTAMRHLIGSIGRLAPFVRTALISGETGTGKELVARALHRAGRRADRPFIVVNCSAVVESLFESELFGHVRGAFAWASDDRAGLFEAADGGVLLLDEVGDLPLGVQAKLLRVLELGEVYRVGSLEPRRVDVQVLASTNRDLRAEVAAGRFRSDLFYRLNIVEIRIPPLRERRDDIQPLAQLFVQECGARLGKRLEGLSPEASSLLVAAPWHGNVRELRNVIERACLLADGPWLTDDDIEPCLPDEAFGRAEPPARSRAIAPAAVSAGLDEPEPPALATVERDHILRALQHARGNKKVAARLLGVSRRALYRRLERLGLEGTIVRRRETADRGGAAAESA
ncbi:MAG TPA: sigma-54 dependent transcriptional regulator [Vicinamibacterales bacterium]